MNYRWTFTDLLRVARNHFTGSTDIKEAVTGKTIYLPRTNLHVLSLAAA